MNRIAGRPAKRLLPCERRALILDAAATVFFEQGYAATSMDAIIERVGGSKRNIYNEFGSKEGLFVAIVSEAADSALRALTAEKTNGQNLRETVTEFALRLVEIYMSPKLIGVYRVTMAEAFRFPDLAKAMYDLGPCRTAQRFAEVLEDAKQRGEIEVEDCHIAADHFTGMLRDNVHLRIVLGLQPQLTAVEKRKFVDSAVTIFLDGILAHPRCAR